MKKLLVFLSFLVLAVAVPAVAQIQPQSLTRMVTIQVKPGVDSQFEEGLKKFHQWEKQQSVAFTFHVWSIVSGPRTLQYSIGTSGHDWKDFDALEKLGPAAQEQIQADIGAYFESVKTSFWSYREDLSGHAFDTSQSPPALAEVTTFFLKTVTSP